MTPDDAVEFAPFRLPAAVGASLPAAAGAVLRRACERVLSFPTLNSLYAQTQAAGTDEPFCERALRQLGVRIDVSAEDLARIPRTGPLIVVANHPFGGLDGLILTALLRRARPDARLLANYLLHQVPELRASCFFVDPFGGPAAAERNRGAMMSAARWVRGGGALGVFPAGEVSHLTLRAGCVTDPPWDTAAARLVRRTDAAVTPVFFGGRNSGLFQLAGLLHPRMRTAMLPRELLGHRGRTVRVQVGSAVSYERLARFWTTGREESRSSRPFQAAGAGPRGADARVMEYLRLRTYLLSGRGGAAGASPGGARSLPVVARADTAPAAPPIVGPMPADIVAAEVAGLSAEQRLCCSGPLQVLVGRSEQIPAVLREIGRLREETFRLVGEGTGREIDLDRFDAEYLHLFVWHAERRHVVGAYRMGQTDVLLKRFGPDGLYTNSLFDFRPRLLAQLDPALELGRSFVRPEYQRDYAPLLLLWKGIGRYIAQHPRYRRMFGAVSISDEFQSMTKQLLMAFLGAHNLDRPRAALVRPRNPPRMRRFRDAFGLRLATLVEDLAEVEELVAEIESNRRGMPVLLRQYLKLNAKLLGFNVDPQFGNVLDGLLLVDLVTVDRAILNRYMGRQEAAAFVALHEGAARAGLDPECDEASNSGSVADVAQR